MQIVRDLNGYKSDADLLLTIGVFDGVHIGHRAVLDRLRAYRSPGRLTAALTFERHPLAFLHPEQTPKALTTMAEKVNLLDACGLDILFLVPFDERIQRIGAREFLEDVLLRRLRTRLLIVGTNWRFGHDRTGDVELARAVLESGGCAFEVESLLTRDGQRVSSSRIRALIEQREFRYADELLGAPFTLRGSVRGGDGRGHLLGVPTANLALPEDKLVPPPGVYAARARYDGIDYDAVVSIGDKPTFAGHHDIAVEVHLLDFERSIYGEEIAVWDWRLLREQHRFENADALVEQMKRDIAAARTRR
ncbi:MAG: riboflavin biosynthesis protein RibF [Candidatus Eremiobacteraeota bacterium]|nr:riboflavin biosynthesis protein RibF [Candidatus Eremiobacteraeota bacterium]MBV8365607.1 riboflavin biosynthesis protein RibF [Candidatus Eremiobacteraeota bacterium]